VKNERKQEEGRCTCPGLKNLQLSESHLADAAGLEVTSRSVTVLSRNPAHRSERTPRVLYTQDLDELKSWVGIPDETVAKRCLVDREHRRTMHRLRTLCDKYQAEVSTSDERSKAAALDVRPRIKAALCNQGDARESLDSIRAHARSYLYGDSTLIPESKSVIEVFFDQFEVSTWILPKIVVKAGSVLAFGPGMNNLLASEVEIETGGQIVSTGSLSVHVGTLRKTMPRLALKRIDLRKVLPGVFGI